MPRTASKGERPGEGARALLFPLDAVAARVPAKGVKLLVLSPAPPS